MLSANFADEVSSWVKALLMRGKEVRIIFEISAKAPMSAASASIERWFFVKTHFFVRFPGSDKHVKMNPKEDITTLYKVDINEDESAAENIARREVVNGLLRNSLVVHAEKKWLVIPRP